LIEYRVLLGENSHGASLISVLKLLQNYV